MPNLINLHHISLTVTDIDRSVAWYSNLLGIGELMREQHPHDEGYVIVLGKPDWSLVVGLHTHPGNEGERFSETRTGLDHLSFMVANRAELKEWQAWLEKNGVEQSPIADRGMYAVIVFRDPDNIQLELIVMGPD